MGIFLKEVVNWSIVFFIFKRCHVHPTAHLKKNKQVKNPNLKLCQQELLGHFYFQIRMHLAPAFRRPSLLLSPPHHARNHQAHAPNARTPHARIPTYGPPRTHALHAHAYILLINLYPLTHTSTCTRTHILQGLLHVTSRTLPRPHLCKSHLRISPTHHTHTSIPARARLPTYAPLYTLSYTLMPSHYTYQPTCTRLHSPHAPLGAFPPLSSQWLASAADLSMPPSFAAAGSLPSALSSPRRSRSQPHRPVRLGHSFPPHIPGDTRRGVAPPTRGSRELPGFPVLPNSGGSGDCGEAFLILAGESAHLMPEVSLLFLYLLPGEGIPRESQGLWGGEGEMTQRGGGPEGGASLEREGNGVPEGKGRKKEDGKIASGAVLGVSSKDLEGLLG